jgi:putative ABC transport system permease protein
MLRLILADLVANARTWLGVLLLTVVVGFVGGLAASLAETGLDYGGQTKDQLISLSVTAALFTGVAALTVLSSSARLTVALQQRGYALWRLVGIPPLGVGAVVLAQLLAVALLGAGFGALLALPAAQPFFDYIFAAWPDLLGARVSYGPAAMATVVASAAGIVLLGGLRGARRASRVAAVQALREPEPPRTRMGWPRWAAAAALTTGLVAMTAGLDGVDIGIASSQVMLIGLLLAALLAALGPALYPVVLAGWTALVPRRASAAWFLARHNARYRLSQSIAAIGPLTVAIALTGGLYTAAETLARAVELQTGRTSGYNLAPEGVIVFLGGPLLLAAVAAAAAVFMSGRARDRDAALVQAAGATPGTVLTAAAWEAVIYVVTAVLLGGLAIVVGGLLAAWALGTTVPGVTASFAVLPPALVAAGGLVLVLAATVLPTVAALRTDVARVLAAE